VVNNVSRDALQLRARAKYIIVNSHGFILYRSFSGLDLRTIALYNIAPFYLRSGNVASRRSHCRGGGGVDVGWGPLRSPSHQYTDN
ncbi:MAG TPA: hypothetical protein VFQ36_24845, partial [Ktedonobacteraceae bacterium]|nr:hypothetical protein [Ktedonobacteraceae bacterium]